jgi:transmembrane E3 ubiquitin-protein ligase
VVVVAFDACRIGIPSPLEYSEITDASMNTGNPLLPTPPLLPPVIPLSPRARMDRRFPAPLPAPPSQTQLTMDEWRERESRQRTVRLLMMFLMMLLLMDEDTNQYNERLQQQRLRGPGGAPGYYRFPRGATPDNVTALEEVRSFLQHRQGQDETLRKITQSHERYYYLQHERNQGRDVPLAIHEWCQNHIDIVRDEFFTTASDHRDESSVTNHGRITRARGMNSGDIPVEEVINSDSTAVEGDRKVWHYPWNTTGFYRGSWTRTHSRNDSDVIANTTYVVEEVDASSVKAVNAVMTSIQLEDILLQRLRDRKEVAAVVPLPSGIRLQNYYNYSSGKFGSSRASQEGKSSSSVESKSASDRDSSNPATKRLSKSALGGKSSTPNGRTLAVASNENRMEIGRRATQNRRKELKEPMVTLTRDDGRAAFQLFGKRIPGMKELSLVTGFLKLYDSTAAGYSTRKDVLLRVQGVLFHSIGRISLLSNLQKDAMAFVMDPSYRPADDTKPIDLAVHRRLQESVQRVVSAKEPVSDQVLADVRDEALEAYVGNVQNDVEAGNNSLNVDGDSLDLNEDVSNQNGADQEHAIEDTLEGSSEGLVWSDIVIPFPFVRDDPAGTIRNARTPAYLTIPQREQALEANAAGCEFEVTMDVSEVEWTVGAWRKLLLRRYLESKMMDPAYQPDGVELIDSEDEHHHAHRHVRPYASSRSSRRAKDYPYEALVMNMVGTIQSPNCNFFAHVNTTALRTDWDATTSKAINYSFYMMVVCLTQILLLLRQLLHSQPQSVATKVSLLCIGWQTVIDAVLCLGHIYLSLFVQPLFTAFASVAFFKLLIFCVIELKYMAIIVQARYNSAGGPTQTSDGLRRQVAMLHIRFYAILMFVLICLLYAPGSYRVCTILALYSFWVPQIIFNVVTETKTPLHRNYIYGMSVTRLVAPLYIFGLRNNFLKEVHPESTTDPMMCYLLVLWVGCQCAVLIAQGKYGARFMIPARFLPPKFDYSRPIPASMLPPGVLQDLPSPESMEDRAADSLPPKGSRKREEKDSLNSTDPHHDVDLHLPLRHQTADTTRNRLHRGGRGAMSKVTEDVPSLPQVTATPAPVLECSICYEDIDIRDRKKYMLAPCNHLYHSECLKQWMDVKMECPICRTNLPAL